MIFNKLYMHEKMDLTVKSEKMKFLVYSLQNHGKSWSFAGAPLCNTVIIWPDPPIQYSNHYILKIWALQPKKYACCKIDGELQYYCVGEGDSAQTAPMHFGQKGASTVKVQLQYRAFLVRVTLM